MKYQIKNYTTLLLITCVTLFSACSKTENENNLGTAELRLINTVEGSANQDFYQGTNKLNTSPVVYGSSSTIVTARAGASTLEFRAVGSGTVTASENIAIAANRSFSVFLHRRADGSPQIIGLENDQNPPETGKARVRFLNLAGLTTTGVTVTDGTTALTTALGIRASSAYSQVTPGTNLSAVVVGSLDVTTISGAEIQAGRNYTIWFDSVSATKVKYYVTVDRS